MEAVLLAVTLMSLAIAVGASGLAFRVMRAERLRSEARIAARTGDAPQIFVAPHDALRHARRAARVEEQEVVT